MWERALELLSAYEVVVFDLDGTLVRLRVDWAAARRAMAEMARDRLGSQVEGMTVWQMLRSSRGEDREALEAVLHRWEVEGAERAERLPLADLLPQLKANRIGVVSLNCRESCEIALGRAGLDSLVDVLVAREDAERLKPDPEPLLKCIQLLGSTAERSVFIGDRDRDRLTAERAGVQFLASRGLQE